MSNKNNIFIEKAKKIHNDNYDYSKVIYIDVLTKIIIICKIHGEFEQSPNSHLTGQGCKKCARKITSDKNKLSCEEFIKKANEKHNNKYDYSKTNYINNITKVKIICKIHDVFEQKPGIHLDGSGCPKCSRKSAVLKNTQTTESYIEKAKSIHGNKFDYSEVKYVNDSTKIKIKCPKHGLFEQRPFGHIKSEIGCPKCGREIAKNKLTGKKKA